MTLTASARRMRAGMAGGEFAVLVAADALAVGADARAEVGFWPVVFFAEFSDSVAEWHGVAFLAESVLAADWRGAPDP